MSDCYRARLRESQQSGRPLDHAPRNKTTQRDWHLRTKYGIDTATYNQMLAEQNGGCAICGGAGKRAMAVDHDHESGCNRELLCVRCNTLIGSARESADILRAAARYLDRHKLRLEA